ncbi:hypothetical protein SprV_1002824900 [Sparganum proliferum]
MSKFLESQQPNCNSTASDGTSSEDKSGEISFASRTCARSTGASSQPPAKRAKSFFQSVYTNEARFLPPSTEELPTPSVSHILFSEGIVRRELEALNESKSPGPDEIPPKLLKELASELSVPLSILFQTSFDTGTLPIDWKLAHITPLYKGGSRASTTNYRPISLTCILCKVMERIMKNELIDFLEVHGLLSNCQHGFRKGRSCTTNLLRSLQSWTRALDDRHEVHIAFIDFQKAFDTVPHQRLLHKLKKIGIGGNFLKWIENFLLGRHQVVCIGQGKSDPAMVGSGVPQGSVLGPILFLIYVDDAARALDCEVAMFADDMKIWSVIRGPADEHILQVNLNRLEEWSSRWLLRFNVAGFVWVQSRVERLPRRDLLIVAGDWTGRTGPGDPTTSHLLGRFGLGSRCENGERLLNFADRNRLLVTNTCFQHRQKHLLTWYSNDGRTASQIDYILVSSRFRSWVHDSRSMRGAETGNAYGSDHVLVRARLKVHLSSAPKMPRPRRLDVAKIRQASTAEALSREIRTCYTTRADGEVSDQWSSLKTSVYGAAEKILGYTQRRRSDWISGRTLQLSAQTAQARSRNEHYFRQLRKMTAKSARDDQKQYWAEIATSMEQASNVGDTRKLYQLNRQVSGKPSTLSDSVRDVNGGFIADNSAKVERWREHFEHHLNYDTQSTSPLLSSSAELPPSPTYAVPCDPPSEEEIVDAIRKLRNNKAPGEDGIPAEIFRSCVDTLAPWLHEVVERAWRDEVVPDDWGLGILVPILKKGDKTRCENYRGISLIDVAAKIFAIVLLRRFQAERDSRTRPNQTGFRAGRGCADQIFTLRRILEFRHSYQQPTAVCFVDFAAAFDSVHRESLWRIMALDGVPAKIITMIKAYYRSTTARVLVRNNLPQPFGIRSGVRQGCILSPILFNYAIDWVLGRALRESDGVEIAPGHRLTDLDYADDIALLASSSGDLQSMVSRVNEVAKSVGLSINAGKTKVFSSCIPDQEEAPLGIDGCQLEEVDSFKYLGARLLPNGQSKDDIVSRIDAARWVFSSLRKCLWNRRDLSIATKIRVYRASVRSVLLYGCECWALRVEDERKLEVFDHHCLRIILRVKFTDFVSNETVRARCDNIARITQAIQERRLRWFGHVLRRPPQELSVTALNPAPLPHWRRRRGGQFKTWLDTVRQDMEVVLGPSVFGLRRWRREWVELSRSAAADRHAWRGTVRDIIEAG